MTFGFAITDLILTETKLVIPTRFGTREFEKDPWYDTPSTRVEKWKSWEDATFGRKMRRATQADSVILMGMH